MLVLISSTRYYLPSSTGPVLPYLFVCCYLYNILTYTTVLCTMYIITSIIAWIRALYSNVQQGQGKGGRSKEQGGVQTKSSGGTHKYIFWDTWGVRQKSIFPFFHNLSIHIRQIGRSTTYLHLALLKMGPLKQK